MATKTINRSWVAVLLLHAAVAFSQESELPAAKPIDPIEGILEAFETYSIVALAEGAHGNLPSHELRLRLIQDPRFARAVNDIVVESGNALYQHTMDRFTTGKHVPDAELRRVWQDTTQANGVWDVPIYEEFFRAVREINASLPQQSQLRVLLGDPPIEWSQIKSSADVDALLSQRDKHPAALIRREVLAKHRRALVVYGNIHYLRRSLYFSLPDANDAETTAQKPLNSIVSLLESDNSTRIFSIATVTGVADWRPIQPDMATWAVPSMTRVADTQLGAQPYAALSPEVRMFRLVDGVRRGFDLDPARSHRIQDQFDAIVFLGARDQVKFSQRTPQLCSDASYVQMRLTRIRIAARPGVANPGDWFERECMALTKQN